MLVRNYSEVEPSGYFEGAKGVDLRVLIGEKEGAPNFTMRHCHVEPGGYTPFHAHPWEHEVFVLSGSGTVETGQGSVAIRPGDSVFIPAGEKHQFRGSDSEALEFICVIPNPRG